MIRPISPIGGFNQSFGDNPNIVAEARQDLTQIMQLMSQSDWQAHWPQIERLLTDLKQNCLNHLSGPANTALRMVINCFPSNLNPTDPPSMTPTHKAQLLQDIMAALSKLHS